MAQPWVGHLFLNSAELYDPATGTFSATGAMTVPRVQAAATLLANGKVLIAGGYGGDGKTGSSAELYDSSTGTFTATGSMAVVRNCPSATLLPNGKVFITYGTGCDDIEADGPLSSPELYYPEARAFVPAGPGLPAVSAFSANLLPTGTVLLGLSPVDCPCASGGGLYDPSSERFTFIGKTAYAGCNATGAPLSDGTVLISGGDEGCATGVLASSEVYDPIIATFLQTGDMTAGRRNHTATLLKNGGVLVTGALAAAFAVHPACIASPRLKSTIRR